MNAHTVREPAFAKHSAVTQPVQCATAGEALVDMISRPQAPHEFVAHLGGAVFNFSRALAQQGVPTAYLNPLSFDRFGRAFAAQALADGVVLAAAQPTAAPTSLAIVSADAEGKASYAFYREGVADRQVGFEGLQAACKAMPELQMVATGCLALAPEDAHVYTRWLQAQAGRGRRVALDINLRPAVFPGAAAYRANVAAAAQTAHIIKASDDDLVAQGLAETYGGDALHQARQWFAALPAQIFILTLGAEGAVVLEKVGGVEAAHWRQDGAKLEGAAVAASMLGVKATRCKETAALTIADTVGAGDCFFAAFIASHLRGESCAVALQHGVASASLCVQQHGAYAPTLAQTQARLAQFSYFTWLL